MTQRIMWEAQVVQDRSQSPSYAWDVPGKIEQTAVRAGAEHSAGTAMTDNKRRAIG